MVLFDVFVFFFFKQKTAYEMRISDWSSDVCSSDLPAPRETQGEAPRETQREVAAPALRPCSLGGFPQVRLRRNRSAGWVRRLVAENRLGRSEERSVGKECGSTCRSGGSP